MRYSAYINNVKANEWGLNLQLAYVFSWIYELPSWAEKVIIGGEVYFFASRTKAISEMPILTNKPDTMYRYYLALAEKNLIKITKADNKDCIRLTALGMTWNERLNNASEINPSVGNKSEVSENDPGKVGNKSERSSEINPTYNTISKDKITIDKKGSVNTHANFNLLNEKIEISLDSIKAYFLEKNYPELEAEKFFYYNSARGWKLNNTPIIKWKHLVKTWMARKPEFDQTLNLEPINKNKFCYPPLTSESR